MENPIHYTEYSHSEGSIILHRINRIRSILHPLYQKNHSIHHHVLSTILVILAFLHISIGIGSLVNAASDVINQHNIQTDRTNKKLTPGITTNKTETGSYHKFLPYANVLANKNIITSTSLENYRLNDHITRGELAKIIANIGGYTPKNCSNSKSNIFIDSKEVPNLCGYIEILASANLIKTTTSQFRPNNPASRAEVIKMVIRLTESRTHKIYSNLQYSNLQGGTYKDIENLGDLTTYIRKAYSVGCIYNAEKFFPNNRITRGEVFKIVDCTTNVVEDNNNIYFNSAPTLPTENQIINTILGSGSNNKNTSLTGSMNSGTTNIGNSQIVYSNSSSSYSTNNVSGISTISSNTGSTSTGSTSTGSTSTGSTSTGSTSTGSTSTGSTSTGSTSTGSTSTGSTSTGSTSKNTLTIVTSPYGTITTNIGGISCGVTGTICSQLYDTGTSLVISANPINGHIFSGWSGATLTGTGNIYNITLNKNQSLTPIYNKIPDAISNLNGIAGASGTIVSLTWTPVSGTGIVYQIYKNNISTPIAEVTTSHYTDTTVSVNTHYSYHIFTKNISTGLRSAPSNTISVSTENIVITNMSVNHGIIGSSVTINGKGFTRLTHRDVHLGAGNPGVKVITDTQMILTVSADAEIGDHTLSITKNGHTTLAPSTFHVDEVIYTLDATHKSIKLWGVTCDGITDDRDKLNKAIQETSSSGITLIIDCPLFIKIGVDIAKPIFLDHNTDIRFSSGGLFKVDNSYLPAFAIINSSHITLHDWKVEYVSTDRHDLYYDIGYYYNSGTLVTMSGANPIWQWNLQYVSPWVQLHRGIHFTGYQAPIWERKGGMTIFTIRGSANDVEFKRCKFYVGASVGVSQYMPFVFSITHDWKDNVTATNTNEGTGTIDNPYNVTFDGISIDGTWMGWQGRMKNSTITNIRSHRYGDVEGPNGENVGGEGKYFPPPHLFYLNDSNIVGIDNDQVTMTDVFDYGDRFGTARDSTGVTSGYTNSLKIGGRNILVDGYTSFRPDGLADILPGNNVTIQNVYGVYNSDFIHGLYPGLRFPSSAPYINYTLSNIELTDLSNSTTYSPVSAINGKNSANMNVDITVYLKTWISGFIQSIAFASNSNFNFKYNFSNDSYISTPTRRIIDFKQMNTVTGATNSTLNITLSGMILKNSDKDNLIYIPTLGQTYPYTANDYKVNLFIPEYNFSLHTDSTSPTWFNKVFTGTGTLPN